AAHPSDYHTQTIPFGQLLAFEYQNETTAELTAVLNTHNQLVGAAIYGLDAPDLINVLTLIIDQQLTGTALSRLIMAFPTPTQGIIDALLPAMLAPQAADTPAD
ncbi:MAG: hypothetical protein LKH97_06735, partial [Levilactobacillus sp.]|nr:hypothetical protein [Levilactobacillus sp.]